MNSFLLVAAGGAIGAAGRYGLGLLVTRTGLGGWPWATLFANVLGSLAIGLVVGAMLRGQGGEGLRLFLAVGVLGGFTTFSSFSLETVTLLQSGQWEKAGAYLAASVILCLLAVAAGLFLMRRGMA
jgi:fluoride exporter